MSAVFVFFTFAHFALVVTIAIRTLLRDDISSSARLAWLIVVLMLPLLGSIVYLFLGEISLPKSMRDKHKEIVKSLQATHPEFYAQSDALRDVPAHFRAGFRYGETINSFPPVEGNTAFLFPDADALQTDMIEKIDAAQESVNVLFYIWLDDTVGEDIADALIRAAERGVVCRAAADRLGSRHLIGSPIWQKLKDSKVQLQEAMPFRSWLGFDIATRLDLRNHRKLTIIDGKTAYVGSKNAAEPRFYTKEKFGPWIDIMMRVEGPVVNQIQLLFASDWMMMTDAPASDFAFNGTSEPDGFVAQYRGTGPLERRLAASQMFCTIFESAEHELTITTPYFVPDTPVLNALQSAALRGVNVTLNVPKQNDSFIVQYASHGSYSHLLQAGVKIFEHGPGILHSKIATVDGKLTLIGSSNLDLRSFDLNFENDMLLYDPDLTQQIRERQQSYLQTSTEVVAQDYINRPALLRLRDNIFATLGPVL